MKKMCSFIHLLVDHSQTKSAKLQKKNWFQNSFSCILKAGWWHFFKIYEKFLKWKWTKKINKRKSLWWSSSSLSLFIFYFMFFVLFCFGILHMKISLWKKIMGKNPLKKYIFWGGKRERGRELSISTSAFFFTIVKCSKCENEKFFLFSKKKKIK